jgi:Bacterial protein of unknown function (DUF839)
MGWPPGRAGLRAGLGSMVPATSATAGVIAYSGIGEPQVYRMVHLDGRDPTRVHIDVPGFVRVPSWMPPNGNGQVSELDPHAETLTLVYQSAIDNPALDMPDNMVIALRTGDLFLSEDNGANNHIRGLTEDGLIFDFAEAKTNPTEFCGVCFDGNGNMMYVNQQGNQEESGVTYAIWGAVEPSVTSRLKGTPKVRRNPTPDPQITFVRAFVRGVRS